MNRGYVQSCYQYQRPSIKDVTIPMKPIEITLRSFNVYQQVVVVDKINGPILYLFKCVHWLCWYIKIEAFSTHVNN